MVEVRAFSDGDRRQVVALWNLVFPGAPAHKDPDENINQKLRLQRELFFVAVDGDRVLGTAMGGYDGHRGWVYRVAVHPSHRRRGIGAALMQRVEEALVALGCSKLNLQTGVGNEKALAFYESLGFKAEPRVSMGKLLRVPSG